MSAATDAIVKLTEEKLAEVETELEQKAGPLVAERDEIKKFLKKITKGSATSSAPATSDEDLLAAVGHCAKEGPAKSPDIAKFLGVDPRTISRRLSAWAGEGKIQGDKDAGYSA